MSAELVASAHKIVLISLPRVRACLGFDGAILIERGARGLALRAAVRGILRPLMEKWAALERSGHRLEIQPT